MKYFLLCWLLLLGIVIPSLARAVTPESGMYYDSRRQGLGYYVEVQGTTLVLLVYGFDQSGDSSTFYYAAGTITQATPGLSSLDDPPAPLMDEFPYQFAGPLYAFVDGPCIICIRPGWNTADTAKQAGKVYIRFADENRLFIGFTMNDGSKIASYVRRQQFGRKGYVVRWRGSNLDPIPMPLYSFAGTWVFTDHADPMAPAWRFDLDESDGPEPYDGKVFGYYGYTGDWLLQFFAADDNAVLKCFSYGCGVKQNGSVVAYFKFWDIGSDRMLGYIGDRLLPDDETIHYRIDHLVTGVRITDPIPDAPPPPTE